jgi:hypothetical protein
MVSPVSQLLSIVNLHKSIDHDLHRKYSMSHNYQSLLGLA